MTLALTDLSQLPPGYQSGWLEAYRERWDLIQLVQDSY